MNTIAQPIETPTRIEIGTDHLPPKRVEHAKRLQRLGRTVTEIAAELGVGRAVVVADLYWRAAYPELVL